jgi:Ca2+-binding RTX toxin-like protein
LSAGAGNDRLYAGAGDDAISGGDGTDTFYFYAEAGNNNISDYAAFEKLILSGSLFSADMLNVVQNGNDAIVTFDNVEDFELTVQNVDATDFDAVQGGSNVTLDFNTVV